jgi:hypothetical protein
VTWTYNAAPDTSSTAGRRDFVRLLIRDTVDSTGRHKLQDEEIAGLLAQHGNSIYRAAALACDLLGAGTAKSKTVGDLSISGLGETYAALGKRYRFLADSAVMPYAGGISVSDKETRIADTDRVTPIFSRNMQSDVTVLASTVAST